MRRKQILEKPSNHCFFPKHDSRQACNHQVSANYITNDMLTIKSLFKFSLNNFYMVFIDPF